MKNQLYFIVMLFVLTSINIEVRAQSIQCEQFKFDTETKIQGSKIFFEGLQNKGDESQIDVSGIVEEYMKFYFHSFSGVEKKKIQNHVSWTVNPLFSKVNDKESADVVVGGYYIIKTATDIEEKLLYERVQNVGAAIPYFEVRQINRAEVMAVISYTYKDNSVDYDTINTAYEYERKPKTKYKSIDDLLANCESSLKSALYKNVHFFSVDYVWYNFKSVKTKDKALKEELKSVNDLLNSGEIGKAGSIYLKVFELDNTNLEAAFNVAQCYELIGNYPKANEYYQKSPDFHAKVRMKSNMILFDYLKSIGANVTVVDF